MAEFVANAITKVGSFMGPCFIHLNGESITVKRSDHLEIAKWPYIVIRQFRAEEEQGRFSFVSGRRGPYGVAEYNFVLSKSMLNELQEALTQFTGAQFSTVAPGSGLDPPPVPSSHRPPHNPIHSSPSLTSINSGGVPSAYERGRGSTSSDSSYFSPSHSRAGPPPVLTGPRLPPRDYLPFSLQQGSTPPTTRSEEIRYVHPPGSYPKPSEGSEYNTIPDHASRQPVPPTHSHNQEPWVLKSSTYETRKPTLRPKPDLGSGFKVQSAPLLPDVPQERPNLPPTYVPVSQAPPTQGTPPTEPKKVGYDRLTAVGQEGAAEQATPPTHHKSEVNISDSTDSTSLDFNPNLTPLIRAKSPEEAKLLQHLRSVDEEGDIVINNSPTIRGRRSPDDRLKRSKTDKSHSPSHQMYDVPSRRMVKQFSADEVQSDSHYHIPKPSSNIEYRVPRPHDDSRNRGDYYHRPKSAEETYKVPVSHNRQSGPADMYDSPKHVHTSAAQPLYNTPGSQRLYNTPGSRPLYNTPTSQPLYNTPGSQPLYNTPGSQPLYNTPGSQPLYNTPGSQPLYNTPGSQPLYNTPGSQPLYNTPSVTKKELLETDNFYTNVSEDGGKQPQENLYNVPGAPTAAKAHAISGENPHHESTNLYNVPTKHRAGSEKQPKVSASDFVDGGRPRLHKLRSAKSAESLFTQRINHSDSHTGTIPPHPEHNMYVDIEQNRPTTNADNLYAEIPANYIPRFVQMTTSCVPQPMAWAQGNGTETHNRDLNRMDTQFEHQKKLAREGYELCLPAEIDPNSLHMMTMPGRGKRASASPPKMLRSRGSSLDKYDIQMPAFRSTRAHSAADLIDNFETPSGSTQRSGDILSTSIPTDSTLPTTDEYVIITRHDNRPKFPPTQPQGVTGSAESGEQSSNQSTGGLDEYQTMTAARIDRSKFLYDTPNPSVMGNGHQSNKSHLNSQPGSEQDTQPCANNSRIDSEASLDMEGIDPRQPQPLGQTRRSSFSSRGSVFSEQEAEVEGQADHVTGEGVAIPQRVRLRIASGSPRDGSTSLELKNRTRSLGNVLDQDATKKHSYVNVKENDTSSSVEQNTRNSALDAAAQTKRPMPLPRPNLQTLQPGDTPTKSRHGYESVNLNQVKGNSHPLSSKSTSSM